MNRIGIVKQAIYEIRTVVEDRRASSIGGINLAFDLWNSAVLPMLLHNGESWVEMLPKTYKVLNDVFLKFLRTIFRIGACCPIMILNWDSASLKPHHHLLQMKLIFIHHLHHLPDSSLAKMTYIRQVSEELPGLIQENRQHLEQIDFENTKSLSKWTFRKLVKKYVRDICKQELLEDCKKYKKLKYESLSREEFKRRDYFNELNLAQVRDRLRLRAEMFGDLKGSFPSKYRKIGVSLKCTLCTKLVNSSNNLDITSEQNTETQAHFLEFCPQVSDLKEQYNTRTDLGIIQFFKAVLERRAEN